MEELNPVQWGIRPLQKYADFSGRAPRAEYWWYSLGIGMIGFVLRMIDTLVLHERVYGHSGPLGLVFTAVCIVPGLAVLIRRLHDIGRSGWWAAERIVSYAIILAGGSVAEFMTQLKSLPAALRIIAGVLYIGLAFTVLIFTVQPGTEGPNRFGSDPYGPDELEEVFA